MNPFAEYRITLRPEIDAAIAATNRPDKFRLLLSGNSHPLALHMVLRQDPDTYCHWQLLNTNASPTVYDYLRTHPDRIAWNEFLIVAHTNKWQVLLDNQPLFMQRCAELGSSQKHGELAIASYLFSNEHPRAAHWFINLYRNDPQDMFECNGRFANAVEALCCMSANDTAAEFLRDHPEIIVWDLLSQNCHPIALELLQANPDKIDWVYLCRNKSAGAVAMLRANSNKIKWDIFSQNDCEDAIVLMQENEDKLDIIAMWGNDHPWAKEWCNQRVGDGMEMFGDAEFNMAVPQPLFTIDDRTYSAALIVGCWSSLYDIADTQALLKQLLNGGDDIFVDEYAAVCREHVRGPMSAELMARMWHPTRMATFAALGHPLDAVDV